MRAAHADDAHEAAQRDQPDAVLGLAEAAFDDRRREAHVELGDPHAHGLGDEEVPELVDEDEREQAADGDQTLLSRAPLSRGPRARSRAGPIGLAHLLARAQRLARARLQRALDERRDVDEAAARAQERRDGLLVGRVQGARRQAAREPAARASARQRNVSASAGSNVSESACVRSRRGAATAARRGYASA